MNKQSTMFWFWLVTALTLFIYGMVFHTWNTAEAQFTNPIPARPVGQFVVGQEEECQHHWHEDLDIIREWQHENGRFLGEYNFCAELLGLGENHWPTNSTIENYPVDSEIIQKEVDAGLYPTFIEACNVHVFHAHLTENGMSELTHQLHLNLCHCRATLGLGACTRDFLRTHPYRYIKR